MATCSKTIRLKLKSLPAYITICVRVLDHVLTVFDLPDFSLDCPFLALTSFIET